MAIWNPADREELLSAIERARPGDRIEVQSLEDVAGTARELLSALAGLSGRGVAFSSLREGVEASGGEGERLYAFCAALVRLDRRERQRSGIERAREEGKYRGRKPIVVDEELFESVAALWKGGQITAREAMARLELKPNTFYRRIKEMEEQKMKDYKQIEKEIRSEVKEAARQSRQDLKELKKQVHAEAEEVRQAAGERLELREVERELRRDRRRAEAEHEDSVRQMKKDVEAEAKELKKLLTEE